MAIQQAEFKRLLNQLGKVLGTSFITSVNGITSNAQILKLVTAVETGDINKIMRAAGMRIGSWSKLTEQIRNSYLAGGEFTIASEIPAKFGMVFDINNKAAQKWLLLKSSGLIKDLNASQQKAIQIALKDGLKLGKNPRQIALDITGRMGRTPVTGVYKRVGGIIGLNGPQTDAVIAMRGELHMIHNPANVKSRTNYFTRARRIKKFDPIVRNAMKTGKRLTNGQVARLTGRYSDNLKALRGANIGRTEALASLSASSHNAMDQVIGEGLANKKAIKRIWHHGGYTKYERKGHRAMTGQKVKFDESFINPYTNAALMYPGGSGNAAEDINCRCYVEYEVDFVAIEKAKGAPLPGVKPTPPPKPPKSTAAARALEAKRVRVRKARDAREAEAARVIEAERQARLAAMEKADKVPAPYSQSGIKPNPQAALNKMKTGGSKTAQIEKFEAFLAKHQIGSIFLNAKKHIVRAPELRQLESYAGQAKDLKTPGRWTKLAPSEANGWTNMTTNHVNCYVYTPGGTLTSFSPSKLRSLLQQDVKRVKAGLPKPFTLGDRSKFMLSKDAYDFLTWIHEMGHQVHFKALLKQGGSRRTASVRGLNPKDDKFRFNKGSKVDPENMALSEYADQDVYEFAAEHFVLWLLDYDTLLAARPKIAKYIDEMYEAAMKG